jgi:hypothetical protein
VPVNRSTDNSGVAGRNIHEPADDTAGGASVAVESAVGHEVVVEATTAWS